MQQVPIATTRRLCVVQPNLPRIGAEMCVISHWTEASNNCNEETKPLLRQTIRETFASAVLSVIGIALV